MTRWDRARPGVVYTCGGCGRLIPAGSPVLVLILPGVSRVRYRCDAHTCAGAAPPDLPEVVVLDATREAATPVLVRGLLPLDWRRRSGAV
jgi:hypothetical protein